MDEQPRRRFWQIHLSTAVAMMIVASVLIGLNLHSGVRYGWPIVFKNSNQSQNAILPEIAVVTRLIANVFLNSAIIVIATILIEYVVRRREVRKP